MGFLDRIWKTISKFQFSDTPSAEQENARKRAQAIAPVVWLLGKTGLGKTAIIAALTGEGFSRMRVAGLTALEPQPFLDTADVETRRRRRTRPDADNVA